MTILGVDTSNHNHVNGAAINWAAVAAAGDRFAILKATEGLGFRDGWLDRDRAGAHAAGLLVGLYHFARAGDPATQAHYFLTAVGGLQVGEFVVLDDEDSSITPAWVQAWCDTVYQQTGVKPLVYMNQNVQNTQNWSGLVADNDGQWLARYDGSTAQPSGGAWGAPAMKQYSDAGTVAGIVGGVDLDAFYGTDQQLAAYGLGGTLTPVLEDDMKLVRCGNTVYVVTQFDVQAIPDPPTYQAYLDAGFPKEPTISQAELDLLVAHTQNRRSNLLTDVHRWVLCRTPDDRPGQAWLYDYAATASAKSSDADDKIGQVQAPAVDEGKLAAALAPLLLADPKNVDALGASIAAHLQLTPRTDAPTPPAPPA